MDGRPSAYFRRGISGPGRRRRGSFAVSGPAGCISGHRYPGGDRAAVPLARQPRPDRRGRKGHQAGPDRSDRAARRAPGQFPQLGAYRYTYVLKYKVLKVHRPDATESTGCSPATRFSSATTSRGCRVRRIKDSDWGDRPLGGKLDRFVAGEAHRLALDYELADLAPSGALDYCFPPAHQPVLRRSGQPDDATEAPKHGLHHPHLHLLLPAAVSAGLFQSALPLAQPVDHGGQLCLLRLVAAVVRLPDDVHHGDGLHLGQSHHPARRDAGRSSGWPWPPAW